MEGGEGSSRKKCKREKEVVELKIRMYRREGEEKRKEKEEKKAAE